MSRGHATRAPEDEGSVLVLLLGFAMVAVLLVTVVADASALYLTRRGLAGATDGAALAAVQQLDLVAFYTGPDEAALPLDDRAAEAAVQAYVARARLADRFTDLEVVSVRSDGQSVTVTLRATRRLPFRGAVLGDGAVVIEATATARAPYVD